MFIIYRMSVEAASRQKIKRAKFNERKQNLILPNNWSELKKYKEKSDVSSAFSQEAIEVVEKAFSLASKFGHEQVAVAHLFFSLLQDKEAAALFIRLNVDGGKLVEKIKNQLMGLSVSEEKQSPAISAELKEVFIESYIEAYNYGQKKVKPLNFILPSFKKDKNLAEILYEFEINEDKIKNISQWFRVNDKLIENYRIYKKMARFKPAGNMDRAYTAVATPILDHFSHDLTLSAKWGRVNVCVGREKETEAIFQI
jgi:ATP-dependent Clp protease ATP-binding subunit ClpA